jgi:hypothetical protein
MEAAEHFNRGQRPAEMPGIDQGLADLITLPSSEGFFEPSEHDRRNPVVDQEVIETNKSRYGKTQVEIFTLENGRHYEVVTGIPRRQRSDIAVFIGTALGTSIRGHNWHTMNDMLELGYPTVLVGPEGGHARWPVTPAGWRQFAHNLFSIRLEETAENMHEILQVTDGYGAYTPGKVIKTGESRDAGITMGFNARAHKFDRSVIYSDAIAPCFPTPKPITISKDSLGRLKEIGTQVGSLARESTNLDIRRALHYPRTINPNPHFLLHMVATVPTLISGNAGKLAREIDRGARIHNTHFTEDPWAFPAGWVELFADHPFVEHDHRPGDHGAIVREDTQQSRVERFQNLLEELEANHQDEEEVNWHNVYLGRLAVVA